MPQIQVFAFGGLNESGYWEEVSDQAVYRRLKRLCEAGLLIHQRTWFAEHGIYRATRTGLDKVGIDLAPARLDKRDYEHDLKVVWLALRLTGYTCEGWITERQIRDRLRPGSSIGRIPDGLFIGEGGECWAVELEVSRKNSQRYYDICDRYASQHRVEMPADSPGLDPEEQLDSYFESGGRIDGVAWYFFSKKRRESALRAANRMISDRQAERYQIEHLNIRFCSAGLPALPPCEKWEAQQQREYERREQERQIREEERRQQEKEEHHRELYEKSLNYLSDKERERAVEAALQNFRASSQRFRFSEGDRQKAIVDAALAKYRQDSERNERKQRRKEAIKRMFMGE